MFWKSNPSLAGSWKNECDSYFPSTLYIPQKKLLHLTCVRLYRNDTERLPPSSKTNECQLLIRNWVLSVDVQIPAEYHCASCPWKPCTEPCSGLDHHRFFFCACLMYFLVLGKVSSSLHGSFRHTAKTHICKIHLDIGKHKIYVDIHQIVWDPQLIWLIASRMTICEGL